MGTPSNCIFSLMLCSIDAAKSAAFLVDAPLAKLGQEWRCCGHALKVWSFSAWFLRNNSTCLVGNSWTANCLDGHQNWKRKVEKQSICLEQSRWGSWCGSAHQWIPQFSWWEHLLLLFLLFFWGWHILDHWHSVTEIFLYTKTPMYEQCCV